MRSATVDGRRTIEGDETDGGGQGVGNRRRLPGPWGGGDEVESGDASTAALVSVARGDGPRGPMSVAPKQCEVHGLGWVSGAARARPDPTRNLQPTVTEASRAGETAPRMHTMADFCLSSEQAGGRVWERWVSGRGSKCEVCGRGAARRGAGLDSMWWGRQVGAAPSIDPAAVTMMVPSWWPRRGGLATHDEGASPTPTRGRGRSMHATAGDAKGKRASTLILSPGRALEDAWVRRRRLCQRQAPCTPACLGH